MAACLTGEDSAGDDLAEDKHTGHREQHSQPVRYHCHDPGRDRRTETDARMSAGVKGNRGDEEGRG